MMYIIQSIHTYVRTYTYNHIPVDKYTHMHKSIHTYTCICIYGYMCICMCVYMYTCSCVGDHMYVYLQLIVEALLPDTYVGIQPHASYMHTYNSYMYVCVYVTGYEKIWLPHTIINTQKQLFQLFEILHLRKIVLLYLMGVKQEIGKYQLLLYSFAIGEPHNIHCLGDTVTGMEKLNVTVSCQTLINIPATDYMGKDSDELLRLMRLLEGVYFGIVDNCSQRTVCMHMPQSLRDNEVSKSTKKQRWVIQVLKY